VPPAFPLSQLTRLPPQFTIVDFANTGLILNARRAGEPLWLRPSTLLAKCWEPLEPDAGNAAEGSEEISAMRFSAHGVFVL